MGTWINCGALHFFVCVIHSQEPLNNSAISENHLIGDQESLIGSPFPLYTAGQTAHKAEIWPDSKETLTSQNLSQNQTQNHTVYAWIKQILPNKAPKQTQP